MRNSIWISYIKFIIIKLWLFWILNISFSCFFFLSLLSFNEMKSWRIYLNYLFNKMRIYWKKLILSFIFRCFLISFFRIWVILIIFQSHLDFISHVNIFNIQIMRFIVYNNLWKENIFDKYIIKNFLILSSRNLYIIL